MLRPGQYARFVQDQHQHRHQECLATDWLGCRSRMRSRMGRLHISSVACSSNRACCHFGSCRGRRRDRFSKPRRLPTPWRALACGAMAACSAARLCPAGPKKIRFRDFWWACLDDTSRTALSSSACSPWMPLRGARALRRAVLRLNLFGTPCGGPRDGGSEKRERASLLDPLR